MAWDALGRGSDPEASARTRFAAAATAAVKRRLSYCNQLSPACAREDEMKSVSRASGVPISSRWAVFALL